MDGRDDNGSALALEEKALSGKIERYEADLDDLMRDLKELDRKAERLSERDPQFDVLRTICASLEELEGHDALHLFWGEEDSSNSQAAHLEIARQSMDEYSREFDKIEVRRSRILEQIGDQNEILDCLDYDLREVMEQTERMQSEWLVEREPDELPARALVMPWNRDAEEDRESRRFVAFALAACLLLGLVIPMIDLPIPELSQLTEVPERVANLLREERKPPPPVEEPPPPPEVEPDEPEELVVEELPEELPEEIPQATDQPVVAEATPEVDTREQVKSKGILAFRDSFAQSASNRPSTRLGSQARVSDAGQNAVGRPERSMVTTSAPGSSGGINLADISRDVGGDGQAIGGVEVTQVASSIGVGDGPDRPLSSGVSAGRTDEEIQIVFDRYKAALYRLYNRELRRDPTLRGQLVLRLTIEPDGSVSFCTLQSSDMDAPALADQVVSRVSGFDFGAKDGIVAMTIIYPIDFLPAA